MPTAPPWWASEKAGRMDGEVRRVMPEVIAWAKRDPHPKRGDHEMDTVSGAVSAAGLREYYDPYTGQGMGAQHFSWSALVMELIDPDPMARSSHTGG